MSGHTTLQITHSFFEKRFTFLQKAADNLCNSHALYSKGSDLISELYTYIYDNQDKLEELIHRDELEPFCISWMKNQVSWPTSPFRQSNSDIEYLEGLSDMEEQDENEESQGNNYRLQQQKTKLLLALDTLDWKERKLYRLYFLEFKSMKKLADELGCSKTQVFNMVTQLRNKITSYGNN